MKTKQLLIKLSKLYPKSIAKKYHDFVGLMVGKPKDEINKIILCLDLDNEIIEEALAFEPDLIISHHPFFYGKKSYILKNDSLKLELYNKLIANNICVYSYHTNFDEGKNGMNDALANKLELNDIKPLCEDPMARGGILPYKMNIKELTRYAANKLNVNYGLYINKGKQEINSIAIVGGGGWHSFKIAQNEGYDCFISGDIPHHGRRDVVLNRYNYIDLPHEVENIFMEQMSKVLLSFDKNLNIVTIYHEKNSSVEILNN